MGERERQREREGGDLLRVRRKLSERRRKEYRVIDLVK